MLPVYPKTHLLHSNCGQLATLLSKCPLLSERLHSLLPVAGLVFMLVLFRTTVLSFRIVPSERITSFPKTSGKMTKNEFFFVFLSNG
jgi:hypothetical protein